jgi:hypothetical protein
MSTGSPTFPARSVRISNRKGGAHGFPRCASVFTNGFHRWQGTGDRRRIGGVPRVETDSNPRLIERDPSREISPHSVTGNGKNDVCRKPMITAYPGLQ